MTLNLAQHVGLFVAFLAPRSLMYHHMLTTFDSAVCDRYPVRAVLHSHRYPEFWVMQILQQSHSSLTQLLGQTSGRDVDKIVEMQKLGFTIAQEYGLPTLAGKWFLEHKLQACEILHVLRMCLPCQQEHPWHLLASSGLLQIFTLLRGSIDPNHRAITLHITACCLKHCTSPAERLLCRICVGSTAQLRNFGQPTDRSTLPGVADLPTSMMYEHCRLDLPLDVIFLSFLAI